jgi:hypothetical protein
MNNRRAKKIKKSRSPAPMNKMFHDSLTPQKPKGKGKPTVAKKIIVKNSGKLNLSKVSSNSNKSLTKSRSHQSLPWIPGNNLKMIKEVFDQVKKHRDYVNIQKIPIKIINKKNSPQRKSIPRAKSIPRMKYSSNTVNMKNSKIGSSMCCFTHSVECAC